ncbi:hypothetical protein [Pararhizobium mangrovi]|uniref:Uncharacterized protein n=1 Tax=Pararhizobium mangrovi TaxID=2590452 RepID=A0A506TY09_9HYPH|nr:hypothetical protein [Pararhizobium mangrovi]TPW25851.1 hypothetical protein FJU11_17485 [Pararhizobium mangrovi]
MAYNNQALNKIEVLMGHGARNADAAFVEFEACWNCRRENGRSSTQRSCGPKKGTEDYPLPRDGLQRALEQYMRDYWLLDLEASIADPDEFLDGLSVNYHRLTFSAYAESHAHRTVPQNDNPVKGRLRSRFTLHAFDSGSDAMLVKMSLP